MHKREASILLGHRVGDPYVKAMISLLRDHSLCRTDYKPSEDHQSLHRRVSPYHLS